jgi:hypothetical protein
MIPSVRYRRSLSAVCLLGLATLGGCKEHASDPTPEVASDSRLPSLHWERGTEHEYALTLTSSFGAPGRAALFDFELRARLTLVPTESPPGQTALSVTLRDVQLSPAKTETPQASLDNIARELERPFGFVFERGVVVEQHLPRGAATLSVGILRTLGSVLQFASAFDARPAWTAEEYDAAGRYVARYEGGREPGQYTRVKERYIAAIHPPQVPRGVTATLPTPTILRSLSSYQLTGGLLQAMRGNERLEVSLQAGAMLESTSLIDLKLSHSHPAGPTSPQHDGQSTVRVAPSEPYGADGALNLDAAKIDGLTVEEAIAGLEALTPERPEGAAGAPGSSPAQTDADAREGRFLIALGTLLRTQPEKVPLVREHVRRGSPAYARLTASLGSAGTEPAHQALLDLIADAQLPRPARSAAALSLARTKTPTPIALKGLTTLSEDPSWQRLALYGLGTYARLLAEGGETGESRRIVAALTSRLEREKDARRLADVLNALSNAASADALGAIKPYLDDRRPAVRAAAVTGLRLIEHPDVNALIAKRVLDDKLDVRLAALDATAGRTAEQTLAESVARAALDDPNSTVRYRSVQRLVSWVERFPALRATLAEVARREKEPEIRALADRGRTG